MKPLVEKFKVALVRHRMVASGEKVLVSVSGGADSVALLHLFYDLRDELGIRLCIAHLNHLARGKASDEDALFVSRLGENLGLETHIEAIDVKKEQAAFKTSFQETARLLRYRFLDEVREKTAANKIALGHTAGDQAETVLINFLRGSGMKGLTGIPPVRGHIIRPLIECFHWEAETFLQNRGLPFRTDLSNTDPRYLRNRIRADLIPKLETEYNKNVLAHIVQTAEILRDEEAFLDACLRKSFAACFTSGREGRSVSLSLKHMRAEPPALQKRLVRKAVFFVNNHLRRLTADHVQHVIALAAQPRRGKELHLPGRLRVTCDGEKLVFDRQPQSRSGLPTGRQPPTLLKISGVTEAGQFRFTTRLTHPKEGDDYRGSRNLAFLDFDKTGSCVYFRFFLPGDRFVPLGMSGTKKLKSFFIDEKIPREQRNRIPILTTRDGDIIWIFGKRISNTYRVTPETKNVLRIEGGPLKDSAEEDAT
ncbi:MAG: tRNA lysidine(34) synthetase TilS [Nitrospinales bacterium]